MAAPSGVDAGLSEQAIDPGLACTSENAGNEHRSWVYIWQDPPLRGTCRGHEPNPTVESSPPPWHPRARVAELHVGRRLRWGGASVASIAGAINEDGGVLPNSKDHDDEFQEKPEHNEIEEEEGHSDDYS